MANRTLRIQGRLPTPAEIFDRDNGFSGTPGFEYALILGANMGKYVAATSEMPTAQRWLLMAGQPLIVIEAPNGKVLDNVAVVCRGERIVGASEAASLCPWYVDGALLKEGGFVHTPPSDQTSATAALAKVVQQTASTAVSRAS